MIDFSKIDDPDYFNSEIENIKDISDMNQLYDILKMLSIELKKETVDPINARMIVGTVNKRISDLTNARNSIRQSSQSGGRQLKLSPTSVSNRAGTVSMIFLVVNVAIITAMYTLLIIAKFIG